MNSTWWKPYEIYISMTTGEMISIARSSETMSIASSGETMFIVRSGGGDNVHCQEWKDNVHFSLAMLRKIWNNAMLRKKLWNDFGKSTQTSPMVGLFFFFNEQAVCWRCSKWKKAYLTSVGNVAMWLYCSLVETNSLVFKKQIQILVKKGFLTVMFLLQGL